jgi:hypothetical protein
MPLALAVGEAVAEAAVSIHRSAAEEVAFIRHLAAAAEVVGFTPHLPASIRAAVWAGSIRRLAASTDLRLTVLLRTVARTGLT